MKSLRIQDRVNESHLDTNSIVVKWEPAREISVDEKKD